MSQHGGAPVEQQMLPPQYQNQAAFQHIRNQTPSASPPIPNGAFHPHPQRQHTPQHDSRPSSRNAPGRQGSNLVPQQHANGFAYMPNPPMYNPQQPGMPPHGLPPHMQGPPMQAPHHGMPPQQAPQYPNYGPPQQHPQQHPHAQQGHPIYAEEQRRTSMPASFPQQERPQIKPEASSPQPQQQQIPHPQPEHQEEEQHQQPQQHPEQRPEPVKRMSAKSRSIFTPIDESRSILSQHWASSTSSGETPRSGTATSATSNARSQSIDVGAASRPPNPPQSPAKARNVSISATSEGGFQPPSRTNSASIGGPRRPVLTVQIPDGGSDGESATGDSSPHSATNTAHTQRNGQSSVSGVVLPPPSPSASALLSAGASGPPNPFARPHPVSGPSQNSNAGSLIETPVSALPSRFMNNEFLPSPSSFYPDWNFNREGNTLPSPLNFATPVVGTGPSFLREDSGERDKTGNGAKRKTPEPENGSGEEGGDSKRSRLAT